MPEQSTRVLESPKKLIPEVRQIAIDYILKYEFGMETSEDVWRYLKDSNNRNPLARMQRELIFNPDSDPKRGTRIGPETPLEKTYKSLDQKIKTVIRLMERHHNDNKNLESKIREVLELPNTLDEEQQAYYNSILILAGEKMKSPWYRVSRFVRDAWRPNFVYREARPAKQKPKAKPAGNTPHPRSVRAR